MVAIVAIKNRELGLMDADLGAGRLLYGYIIQDTNRGGELKSPTLPLTLTFSLILVTFLTFTQT